MSGYKHMQKDNPPLVWKMNVTLPSKMQLNVHRTARCHIQRTAIFILTAVIISILRPALSRRVTKRWRFGSTERHWRSRLHSWCQNRRGMVTLDSTQQWHLSSVADQFTAPNRILEYLQLSTWQSEWSGMQMYRIKDRNTAKVPSFLSARQYINYSAQCLFDCVRNVSHITYRTFCTYRHSLTECSIGLRLQEYILLK